jgi:hypothetical protein
VVSARSRKFAGGRNFGWNMEECANTCSRKLLVLVKESKNIKPGKAELERKVVKFTTTQIYCVKCLSIRANVSTDITHTQPELASLVSILANF